MNSTSVRLALLVLGSLVLVSCSPTAAPAAGVPAPTLAAGSSATSTTQIPTLSPTASWTPKPAAAPTEAPSPSPQPRSTSVPPAAEPAATQSPEQEQSVTLADNGQTIQLRTGERFLLDLGPGYDWTVNVANPSILSRVVNVLVIQGAQGIYEAKQPGTTTITATGDPPCRKATPPCAAPSRIFRVVITVR